MGRSVSYLGDATYIAYFDVSCDCEDGSCYHWEDFTEDITDQLQDKFQSLEECDRWEGNEDHIILENTFVEIGISEYCGLASVSVRVHEDIDEGRRGLAERFIGAVETKLKDMSQLKKVGTFSNGEGVYERVV